MLVMQKTTLNMVFCVTYYFDIRNAISNYCISQVLSTKVKYVVCTL